MTNYLTMLFITLLVVYVIDYSGFIEEMEKMINERLKNPVKFKFRKPLCCSLCLSWWINLLFTLFCGTFSMKLLVWGMFLSMMTGNINRAFHLVVDGTEKIIEMIEKLFRL